MNRKRISRDDAMNAFNEFILKLHERQELLPATEKSVHLVKAEADALGLDVNVSIKDGSMNVQFLMPTPVKVINVVTTPIPRSGRSVMDKDFYYEELKSRMIAEHGYKLGTFMANRAMRVFRKRKLHGHCYGGCYVKVHSSIPSVAAYHEAKGGWQFGWAEETFNFTRRLVGFPVWRTKVTIGFAYE